MLVGSRLEVRVRKLPDIFMLALPGVLGACGFLAATPRGIGIYPDSVMYILMARSLLHGNGWSIDGIPVVLFPPMYSALLALPGLVGLDPIDGARWVQTAIWGLNIFWIAVLAHEFSGKSLLVAMLASVLAMGAVDLLGYHVIALSDAAFLFFALPGLLTLDLYLTRKNVGHLALSAVLFAFASLTRYAGVAWIAGGILTLLILEGRDAQARLRDALIFGVMSSLPSAAWMVRNMWNGSAMGRHLDVHGFLGKPELQGLIHASSAWFFQWKVPDSSWMTLLPLALITLLIWRLRNVDRQILTKQRQFFFLIFTGSYSVLLIVTAAFFQADLFRDSARLMMPLHALFLVWTVIAGNEWFRSTSKRGFRVGGVILSSGFVVFVLTSGFEYARKISRDGQGYAGIEYRYSPLIQKTKSIPTGITLYSNLSMPVALYTDRIVYTVPPKINNGTQRPNETYDDEMRRMALDIRDSSAALVYFDRGGGWLVLPTLDEIRQYVALRCSDKEGDGGIYEGFPDTTVTE